MELKSLKQRYGIIGDTPGLNYALSIAQRVAPTSLSVLIAGESGVGKESFSRIIHDYSPRKHSQFIAINTGAIPEGTIDSELFGHTKGAFTGAASDRKGYFETVNGGTIFLDEIGEMPLGTQARLLRVLETGEFIRVGASKVQKTDVRVVAATNKNLLEQVAKGKFREDLYYRLSTVPIQVPALRNRQEDIVLLFRKFASDFAEKYRTDSIRLSEDAKDTLQSYAWPGNIRELKNVAEQISVLSDNREIDSSLILKILPDAINTKLPMRSEQDSTDHFGMSEREIMYKMLFDIKKDMNSLKTFVLQMAEEQNFVGPDLNSGMDTSTGDLHLSEPIETFERRTAQPAALVIQKKEDSEEIQIDESLSLAEVEKEYIQKALSKHRGKRRDAALDLGISERTLYRKIKEYELDA